MKILSKFLPTLLLFSVIYGSSWGQTKSYTIQKKLSTNAASSFWSQPNHGIKLNSFNTTFDIKVEVTTVDNINFQYFYPCIGNPIYSHIHNAPLTMFATAANQLSSPNSKGYINDWQGENPLYYYRSILVAQRPCESGNVKPDTREFFKNQALITRWTLFPFNILDKMVDVKIKVTLIGNIDINIIKEIAIPGVDAIYSQDLIKKTDYTENHECFNSTTGVCAELNKVRSIPDLNKTDVVIQAHRGVWGKPNTNQENTRGAMEAANSLGIKVLESDIMPVNVRDGGTYVDSLSGKPEDLACFHDFILTRYTTETNNANRIYNKTKSYLEGLDLKKPRSIDDGLEKIMFFEELINYAADNNLIVCVDMKNLEPKGSGGSCTELCGWQEDLKKKQSLYHNLKFAINSTDISMLKNMAIKTYATYNELKDNLTTGDNPVSVERFNKVLWAPIIAASNQWVREGDISGAYDPLKIQKFLDDWFAHNETVLYYETNFFNDFDGKTSVMLSNSFSFADGSMVPQGYNVMEYIYRMTGRRAGIFSEEPVGGKGTVNRWGSWGIKNPVNDRRGDHLWLLKKPFFKHAVITTDRPDQWIPLND